MIKNDKLPNPQVDYKGTFARLIFPPYEHQEYPKFVQKGSKRVVVQSQREELDFLANTEGEETEVERALHPIEAERNDLAQKVAEQAAENAKLKEQLAAQAKSAEKAVKA